MNAKPRLLQMLKGLPLEGWIFLGGFSFLVFLELLMRRFAIQGLYFQEWRSEDMVQTLPLLALRDEPVASFIYLHIQPPALDLLRMLLVQLFLGLPEARLLVWVDQGLYLVWAILYGLLGALLYHWLAQLSHRYVALVAAALFLLHPAAILYASFLDNTLLFSLGILWSSYELWKVYREPRRQGVAPLAISVLLLYFIHPYYQAPVLLVYILGLFLMRVPGRKLVTFIVITAAVILFYTTRQLYLFGTPYSSSLVGRSCLQALGQLPDQITPAPPGPILPKALALDLPTKLGGARNWNSGRALQENLELFSLCSQRLRSQPISETWQAYRGNLAIYLSPSAQFVTSHILADRLPWRSLYNRIFSNGALLLLNALALAVWLVQNGRKRFWQGLGLALPTLFVIASSLVLEGGEAMRARFFIEPVLYVFVVAQFYTLWQAGREGFKKRAARGRVNARVAGENL